MHLRLEIERFLRANPGVTVSELGKEIAGDPGFVQRLRKGREMRVTTERRATENFKAYLERRNAN